MRFKVADIAPAVDKVIGEQLLGLANALGGALPPTREEKAAAEAETPPPEATDSQDDQGLDAAVADLVEDKPPAEPERPR